MTFWPSICSAAALCAIAPLTFGAGNSATVNQPRAFGHMLGDVLTQRVLLGPNEIISDISVGRIGTWLDRRPVRFETDTQVNNWLLIDYQITNSPRGQINTTLPALSINPKTGGTREVAAWPISIGPLAPDNVAAKGDLVAMRPSRAIQPTPTAPLRDSLVRRIALLAFVAAGWLAWWIWRNRRDAVRLPFERAWHQLRHMEKTPLHMQPAAWRCLHHAIDSAAGRVMRESTLSEFLESAPYLHSLRKDIEAFYQRSGTQFFAAAPDAEPFPLRELALALRNAERRHYQGSR